ncbi:NAD(+) synthase [Endobacter medicaginis]|uniref:NAD(+) synthase n=1 Tax=Endobacter medicaginis TaxID=1181271 RepID=UPI0029390D8E|nr:NAD(+) synthase [Endobacter medicaginis]
MPDPTRFHDLYAQGFLRVAACTAPVVLADPHANARAVIEQATECAADGVGLAVFPELGLVGYTISDLLLQQSLLDTTEQALADLAAASASLLPVLVVGAPLRQGGALYNCAVVIHRGRILGAVPKSYRPNYREFYEARTSASGIGLAGQTIAIAGDTVPFGTDLLFAATDLRDFVLHVEICEDLWVAQPPSGAGALAGATVLANPSASPITIGRADTRTLLCRAQSSRCLAAYVYAAAGEGESTTDLAWDGQVGIYEAGDILAESGRFPTGPSRATADIDLMRLAQERLRMTTFIENARATPPAAPFRRIGFTLDPPIADLGLRRPLERFPFVPSDPARLASDCYEAYAIQVSGLVQRLRATATKRVVIGISGGLDSTQALIVAARAFDRLGLPRSDILAWTMPGFATSGETKANAWALMDALGVRAAELDIRPSAELMLRMIDHPAGSGAPVYDTTFENVQAGLRTDYLFRLANHHQALVLGTGDLSEIALGWSTYGVGDHMSHYNVNSGVPKTLIQHLIRWVAEGDLYSPEVGDILRRILATEISPELVPAGADGAVQSTEAKIGPYALQDFTLFHVLRHGFGPARIAFLAEHAWSDPAAGRWPQGIAPDARRGYDLAEIRHWLGVFVERYFGFSQFKRSAMPNGPKVSHGGSLSPRGDWRAPSDGNAALWRAELAAIPES